ncbi:MAG: HAD-IA family hydrolase [Lachnospiraceae bacterium]|jgi:HAD superfamily hydrolase (TIGR01549 family)|nr:HAD-IA family hydrolase [Lachnospiraceae bacterium]
MHTYDVNNQLIKIKKLIDDPKIKIVSFDIFDTLLVRPALYPQDIFYLADQIVKEKYNKSFLQVRLCAENKLKNPYINIHEIWDYIMEAYHLSKEEVEVYKNIEIKLEEDLLYARKQIYELYRYAVYKKKKIAAISDMYLPSDILKRVLKKNGYKHISKVYVSCECKKRKDSGELYAYFLKEQCNYRPDSILHIGDNYKSDYQMAKKAGLEAAYIPSNLKQFFSNINIKKVEHWDLIHSSLVNRIFLGFGINVLFDSSLDELKKDRLSLNGFVDIILFPMLLKTLLFISNETCMDSYRQISFASRDGFLPFQMFEILNKYIKGNKKAIYFDASRQAYSCITEGSIYDKMNSKKISKDYTIEDYINSLIIDDKIKTEILKNLPETEKSITVLDHQQAASKVLDRNIELILEDRKNQKAAATTYYHRIFDGEDKREIVFDCGYSGSVSNALSKVFDGKKLFDKLYIWENQENKNCDQKNNTVTYAIFGMLRPAWMDELIECCLSPLKGGCKGFSIDNGILKTEYEQIAISDSMSRDIQGMQNRCLEHTEQFMNVFSQYISLLKWDSFDIFVPMAKYFFITARKHNETIFQNIFISDSFSAHNTSINMSEKIRDMNHLLYQGKMLSGLRKVKYKICGFSKKIS